MLSTDAEPGRQYTAVVMDNESIADATGYRRILYVSVLGMDVICRAGCMSDCQHLATLCGVWCRNRRRVPPALIAPNPDYAAYLRIFAGAAFIVGLAGLAGRMQG